MSWHFSRALVEAYLGESSSDGGLSALLKSMPTASGFYSHARMTDHSQRFQSGMTLERLTAFHGEELLTWFLADGRAKISVHLGLAKESPARKADSTSKPSESFAKWDHVSRSWKTLPCSQVEESTPFSGSWPRWGTMSNGVCSVRPMPHGLKEIRSRITNAIESGFVRYPTPRANDAQKRGNFDVNNPRNGLAAFVRRYPTPMASDGQKWNNQDAQQRIDRGQQVRLPNALTSEYGERVGGKQSPEFTEWLMGWPIGWTDLRPLETDKFHQWLDSHGKH